MLQYHIYSEDHAGVLWLSEHPHHPPHHDDDTRGVPGEPAAHTRIPHNQDDGVVRFTSVTSDGTYVVVATARTIRVHSKTAIAAGWTQSNVYRPAHGLFTCLCLPQTDAETSLVVVAGTDHGDVVVATDGKVHTFASGLACALTFVFEHEPQPGCIVVGGSSATPQLLGKPVHFYIESDVFPEMVRSGHCRAAPYYALTCGVAATEDTCVTGDIHGKLLFWDVLHGNLVDCVSAHGGAITMLVRSEREPGETRHAAAATNGRLVCSASTDWKICVWCGQSRRCMRVLRLADPSVHAMCFSQQSLHAAVGRQLVEWDVATGSVTAREDCPLNMRVTLLVPARLGRRRKKGRRASKTSKRPV